MYREEVKKAIHTKKGGKNKGGQNMRDVMLLESRFYFMLENVIRAGNVNSIQF